MKSLRDGSIEDMVLSEIYRVPGVKAREVANDLAISRREVNRVLYGLLKGTADLDRSHRWWPKGWREASDRQREVMELHRHAVLALLPSLRQVPQVLPGERPLDIHLRYPLPDQVRAYVFKVKGVEDGERGYINLTIGGPGEDLRSFDRTGGFVPLLLGHLESDGLFVIWDADVYDLNGGFRYNRFCYVDGEKLLEAIAVGESMEVRTIRQPAVEEVVVVCRESRLGSAIHRRLKAARGLTV